jgi:hypothetical protein
VKIRRVATGHNSDGKSVFSVVDEVEGLSLDLFPGWQFFDIWGGDEIPHFPDAGAKPPKGLYFPPVNGFRFSFSLIPPETLARPADLDVDKAREQANALAPGMAGEIEEDGMHTTSTIDFEVIMSGKVYLQLEDGVEELLQPGDTVIQNGTRHLWRNPGPESCLMAVFMVGAEHDRDRS